MGVNKQKRLFQATEIKKQHYKAFKVGKFWVTASVTLVFGTAFSWKAHVLADSINSQVDSEPVTQTNSHTLADSLQQQTVKLSNSASNCSTQNGTTSDSQASAVQQSSTAQKQTNNSTTTSASSVLSTSQTTAKSASSKDKGSQASPESNNAKLPLSENNAQTKSTNGIKSVIKLNVSTNQNVNSAAAAGRTINSEQRQAESIITVANVAASQVASYAQQDQELADRSKTDNIPDDNGLRDLNRQQQQENDDLRATLATVTEVNPSSAQGINGQLIAATNILTSMQQAVVQAAALAADDHRGIQAAVFSKAQSAYATIQIPLGSRAQLDAYGDLIVTAPSISAFQQVVNSLNASQKLGEFRAVVDPTEDTIGLINPKAVSNWQGSIQPIFTTLLSTDGSHNYQFTTDATYNSIDFAIQISGKAGDTYSVTVPSDSLSDYLGGVVTGNPTVTNSNVNGQNWKTYTWEITGAANSTQVITQNFNNFSLFNEYPYNYGATFSPYTTTYSTDKHPADYTGQVVPVKFQINGQDAGTDTIVLKKDAQITGIAVEYGTSKNAQTMGPKTLNTDYVYDIRLKTKGNQRANSFEIQVPVPTGFELDSTATEQYELNRQNAAFAGDLLAGDFTVTQSGGAGTPIIIQSTRDVFMSPTTISFVGQYTSVPTTGKSDGASGWIDYGDGQHQAFGLKNIETGAALTANGTYTGFDETILPPTDARLHEAFNIVTKGTNNLRDAYSSETRFIMTSGYDNVNGYGSIDNTIALTPGQNNPSLPDLLGVGLIATGATQFTPTYQITLPTEITSTGIVMPLNNVNFAGADYGEYNSAQKDYTVTVTSRTGEVIVQQLTSGESYNPLTGVIDDAGFFLSGKKLAAGSEVAQYEITPGTPYYANAELYRGTEAGPNDIDSGLFNVLGYLNSTAVKGQSYQIDVHIGSEHFAITDHVGVLAIGDQPVSKEAVNGNPETKVLTTGQTTTATLTASGVIAQKNNQTTGTNLDAAGILTNQANQTSTDLTGGLMNPTPPATTIFEPIVYVTVPTGTQLITQDDGQLFAGSRSNDKTYRFPTPKYTELTDSNGQSVWKVDWTGTGYTLTPGDNLAFTFKANQNLLAGFSPETTSNDCYEYHSADGSVSLLTADDLAKLGVSTTGLVKYAANLSNGTATFQLGGDTSQSQLTVPGQITLADGTTIKTTQLAATDRYLQFIVTSNVELATQMRGTADVLNGFSANGNNYPGSDLIGQVGQQKFQFGATNNTENNLTNIAAVVNLPQVGQVDSNNPANKVPNGFTLQLTGPASLVTGSDNNPKHDQSTLLYSTDPVTVGKNTLIFKDGTIWTIGNALPQELLTAGQVTDWSKIKAVVLLMPSLSKQNQVYYQLSLTSPTSANNSGLTSYISTELLGGGLAALPSSVADTYYVRGTVDYVDQDGNEINGYPVAIGSAKQNSDGSFTAIQPMGKTGDQFPAAPQIPGYVLVSTTGDKTLKADGTAKEVFHYQVDEAQLVDKLLNIKATTKGDSAPQNGAAVGTGTNQIRFGYTDADLAQTGLTYQVQVVDSKGQPVKDGNGNYIYPTLASALANQGTFDQQSDAGGASQVYQVLYYLPANAELSLKKQTKVYDNDKTTDPKTYQVSLPASLKQPTWVPADFDQSGITSQDVGTYSVKLSSAGWQDLEKVNPDISFTLTDPSLVKSGSGLNVSGSFVITKAQIVVQAPSLSKTYDGSAYTGSDAIVTVTGVPTKGAPVTAKFTDISKIVDAGTTTLNPTVTSDNANYTITLKDGLLTILPKPLTVALVNTPTSPVNPTDPAKNGPASAESLKLLGAEKVYDGDASTDPTTFELLGPTEYTDFKLPKLTPADFDVSGMTSQDVGRYVVKLSDSGLQAIQKKNPNYLVKMTDIQNGLFVITPATVTVTVKSVSKVYDGEPVAADKITNEISALPKYGVSLKVELTDAQNWVDVGEHTITDTTAATENPNYQVNIVPGTLSITKRPLVTASQNTPSQPFNGNHPVDNRPMAKTEQGEHSLTLLGYAKVYDGDWSTDPINYQLLGPAAYSNFVIPAFVAADFDITGITSQNVGNYVVRLNTAGLQKLIDNNPNYLVKMADIENALLVITPAKIKLVAPQLTKKYDGQPYSAIIKATEYGVPKLGVKPRYQVTGFQGIKRIGNYDLDFLVDDDNSNYQIDTQAGHLTITPDYLTVTTKFQSESGQSLADNVQQTDFNFGDAYHTQAKLVPGYQLLTEPINADGHFDLKDITVTYVYRAIAEQPANSQPVHSDEPSQASTTPSNASSVPSNVNSNSQVNSEPSTPTSDSQANSVTSTPTVNSQANSVTSTPTVDSQANSVMSTPTSDSQANGVTSTPTSISQATSIGSTPIINSQVNSVTPRPVNENPINSMASTGSNISQSNNIQSSTSNISQTNSVEPKNVVIAESVAVKSDDSTVDIDGSEQNQRDSLTSAALSVQPIYPEVVRKVVKTGSVKVDTHKEPVIVSKSKTKPKQPVSTAITQLPQTGEKAPNWLIVLGLSLFVSLLGVFKKHEN